MAAAQLRLILNGPVVAGVGATVDAGLPSDKFHVLPWDPKEKITISIKDGPDGVKLGPQTGASPYSGDVTEILKYALWNTKNILGFDAVIQGAAAAPEDFKTTLERDTVAIAFLMIIYGYYGGECRATRGNERHDILATTVSDELLADIVNPTRLNRAATFLLARMHTKYQTNHAIGGTPMQASMASSVRAFYSISPSSVRSPGAVAQMKCISDCIYWAVHPANETLLIPSVITSTRIESTKIHKYGPFVELMGVEEYFAIRARTPPASTHHFYVAAASIKQLEPLGILPYLPDPTRTKDVVAGLRMIEAHGAKLHPAARYWGIDRLSANQKMVETLCADLGYAVRKLMPASSLAASPILAKEDALDSAWKGLIDALRSAMDDRGRELLDERVFAEIKKSIAPTAGVLEGISEIKGYLTSGHAEANHDEDESEDESSAA